MTPEEERKLLMQLVSGQISKQQYESTRYNKRIDALRAGLPPDSRLTDTGRSRAITDRFGTPPQDIKDPSDSRLYSAASDYESQVPEAARKIEEKRNRETSSDYDSQVPPEAGSYEEAVETAQSNREQSNAETGSPGGSPGGSSSNQKDEFGFTADDYKNGIRVYRKDSKDGELVYSYEDLLGVLNNGYSLSNEGIYVYDPAAAGQPVDSAVTQDGQAVTSFTNSQIWEKDGNKYVVWQIPNTLMFMRYAATESELNMLYSGRQRPSVVSPSDDIWTNSVYFGSARELDDKVIKEGESPFLGFVDTFDKATLGRPWLKTDDGMFKLWTEGFVENREILPEEWANTEWWNNSTKEQREWLTLSKGRGIADPNLPADAKTFLEENRFKYRELLKQSGISNVDLIKDANGNTLSEFFGDQITFGNFSEGLALEQIKALSDRTSGIQVDERITNWLEGKGTVEQTKAGYAAVQEIADRWLGPAYGKLDETTMASYASIYRNAESEAVGRFEINEKLKAARRALFNPEIYDETLTYEDIATPWRNWAFSYLGERMNETSDSFMKILQSNDQNVAQQEATVYGLNTDNETVYDKVTSDLIEAIGADVQRGFST